MNETQSKLDGVPESDDSIPANVRSRNGDAWYEYDGELLWDEDLIERIYNRLSESEEADWHPVSGTPMSQARGTGPDVRTRVKIRTEDADEFRDRLEEKVEEVAEEIGGWLVGLPKPEINEKGPRRTDVYMNYSRGRKVSMGGEEYKRGKIIQALRNYEMYLYHTCVVDPLFEEFNEKYPY